MKQITFLLINLVFVFNLNANLTLNKDSLFAYVPNQEFDAYEPVLIQGTYAQGLVQGIDLKYLLNNNVHPVGVSMANGNWSASLGSFLPRQSILLQFNVQVKVDLSSIEKLRHNFITKLAFMVDSLNMNRAPEDTSTQKLQDKLLLASDKVLKNDFENFKDESGKSLKAYIIEGLKNPNEFMLVYNLTEDFQNKKSTIDGLLNALYKFNQQEYQQVDSLVRTYNSTSSLKNIQVPQIDTTTVDSSMQFFAKQFNGSIIEYDSLRRSVYQAAEQLVPSIVFLSSIPFKFEMANNQTLRFPIRNFIGFELMPTYFINRDLNSTFGLFFTASPYFGRVDTDEQIFQKGTPWANLKRFVSPTLGFGLTTSPKTNQISPLVYAGIGFRMNNIVRVSVGTTFFTQKYETPTDGTDPNILAGNCFTVGIGISTDYLADFMKIFSTTINQFGK